MVDFESVKKLMESEEWELIRDNSSSDSTTNGLREMLDKPQLVFKNKYAVVGMVFTENVSEVERAWISCQSYMSKLCADGVISSSDKDLYLIFFISCMEPDALRRLRPILDNPFVCRKICVENNQSDIKKLLGNVPLIRLTSFDSEENQANGSLNELEHLTKNNDLSDIIMNDLYKRSAETILDYLINGKYDGVKPNENKKSDA